MLGIITVYVATRLTISWVKLVLLNKHQI